jgi:hypothetical protein
VLVALVISARLFSYLHAAQHKLAIATEIGTTQLPSLTGPEGKREGLDKTVVVSQGLSILRGGRGTPHTSLRVSDGSYTCVLCPACSLDRFSVQTESRGHLSERQGNPETLLAKREVPRTFGEHGLRALCPKRTH